MHFNPQLEAHREQEKLANEFKSTIKPNLETKDRALPVIKNAIRTIEATRSGWAVTGAIDSEMDDTNILIAKLEKGEISAEKALEELQGMDDRRMDYH